VHANPTLREHVRARAENRPGVYRIFDVDSRLVYVGKSVRVRSRLLSYFRAARGDKAWELIREAGHIDWAYEPNEFAALLREMRLIHRHRPRYNVEHNRRRSYAFVKITAERAPRLLPVTRVAADGAEYFGPFPGVGAVRRTVLELGRVLGLRDCPGSTGVFFGDQLDAFGGLAPPRCLRAEFGSCLAPCCGRPTESEYRAAVRTARAFLTGHATRTLRELESRMRAAARRMDFEYARLLRDRLERLTRFSEDLTAFRGAVEDLSIVYRVPGYRGDDRLYLIRRGRLRRELPHPKSAVARGRAAEAVRSVFGEPEPGPPALSADEAAEVLLIARWFRLRPKERLRAATPAEWLHREETPPGLRTPLRSVSE